MAQCWWCAGAADSREHKFKRRDLTAAFGHGAWLDRSVAHSLGRAPMGYPNSSRSRRLKFPPALCSDCNGKRSQRIDHAYDRFADFVRAHGEELYASRILDWRTIFPSAWEQGRDDVTRYWIKHICCRLSEQGVDIDPSLAKFLDGLTSLGHIRLWLEVRQGFVDFQKAERARHGDVTRGLWVGDMIAWADRRSGRLQGVASHWGIDAIFVLWEYSVENANGVTNFVGPVVDIPLSDAT